MDWEMMIPDATHSEQVNTRTLTYLMKPLLQGVSIGRWLVYIEQTIV
jgi:hypothetical protein